MMSKDCLAQIWYILIVHWDGHWQWVAVGNQSSSTLSLDESRMRSLCNVCLWFTHQWKWLEHYYLLGYFNRENTVFSYMLHRLSNAKWSALNTCIWGTLWGLIRSYLYTQKFSSILITEEVINLRRSGGNDGELGGEGGMGGNDVNTVFIHNILTEIKIKKYMGQIQIKWSWSLLVC